MDVHKHLIVEGQIIICRRIWAFGWSRKHVPNDQSTFLKPESTMSPLEVQKGSLNGGAIIRREVKDGKRGARLFVDANDICCAGIRG